MQTLEDSQGLCSVQIMTKISPKPSVTVPLLRECFSLVLDLRTYLSEVLQPADVGIPYGAQSFEPTPEDGPLYHALLNTAYVAHKADNTVPRHKFKVYPSVADVTMREVLEQAQEKVFQSKRKRDIIISGYRRFYKDKDRMYGIRNYFVNTIITALQGPEWETLLQRVGVDAMRHLLSTTSIFVSLPNDCLCQMTGDPIFDNTIWNQVVLKARNKLKKQSPISEKRAFPFTGHDPEARLSKRAKLCSAISLDASCAVKDVSKPSPADISFIRTRLLYSRPVLVPQFNQIVVGLPIKYILNRIAPSYRRQPKVKPEDYVDPDAKIQEKHARHLAKYIFPRQYGLTNAFTQASSEMSAYKRPDYTDRELEIQIKGSCKTPKRLKDVLPLLDTMIWRHGKCGYKPLRDITCPSKLKNTARKDWDSSIILELMSEESILLTQPSMNTSVNSSCGTIAPFGSNQAKRHAKVKPRFADFTCSPVEVYRYVALVTRTVIPQAFWGSENNLKVILQYVEKLVHCRRFETLTLHNVLQGFSTTDCDWLMPPGTAVHKQTRVSVSDALKRRELLREFIFWYFDSFVSHLLKTNFYITESSAFKNRMLYFRQDDWQALCSPLIERLTAGTFMKISESEAHEVLRQRKLGFSFVRLLPKETGVRPIVNLRRRKPAQTGGYGSNQSINDILKATFSILTYEKKNQPQRLGASVANPNDMYPRLKAFKSRLLRTSNGSLPRLYFVKVDVQACFDTIEQTKLLEILRDLISEDCYMIQKYGQIEMKTGRPMRTFVKKAMSGDDHPHFLKYATDLASVLRHVIFVDEVTYPYEQKKDILQLLEDHITENIVKIGPDFYRQTVGIPQGSILSSILCSFFYGDLEKKRFTKFTSDLHSVLLRMVDDYLFITTDRSQAIDFLDMMNRGHPDYGCFISKEKVLTSFDYDTQIMNVTKPNQRHFPWCGHMINMEDLSVSVDYSSYNILRDNLTVGRTRKPGTEFAKKMLRQANARCHPIFSDSTLNTETVVYINIYQNFLLCAMKMHSYLYDLGFKRNPAFILSTVRDIINSSYLSVRYRYTNHLEHESDQGPQVPPKSAIVWLGNHAFHTVLSRKPLRYAYLLRSLKAELSKLRSKRYKKQFGALTKEGLAGLSHILF